ncbi:hypothetical protein [Thalassospira xiamenensis]|uniref:Uncharacterized protein n=1 Tax=Thalassospira xiamenensis TaxID=220697 RepID=A0A285TY92_9PROT|nr:hypothetical protein [Thalassospira xiamenensis]SOC30959.1 hypothetical protein SAMN05428964_11133 [Thalassospira xiamenensis]
MTCSLNRIKAWLKQTEAVDNELISSHVSMCQGENVETIELLRSDLEKLVATCAALQSENDEYARYMAEDNNRAAFRGWQIINEKVAALVKERREGTPSQA